MTPKSLFSPLRYPALQRILADGDAENTSRADDVYDAILLQIVRGELPGGSELNSTRLAEQLSVSRTPVVQALARLTADGIVQQHRHRRAVVRAAAQDWLVDVHQLRELLEPPAAALAAGQIEDEVLADLEMLAREARPTKAYAWTEAARHFDYSLHLVVAEYCGNLPMRSAIRRCWSYKRISYQAGNDTERGLRQGYREHLEILKPLAEGDAPGARAAVTRHLQSAARLRPQDRIV